MKKITEIKSVDIFTAVNGRDLNRVKNLIEGNPNLINSIDQAGRTPIFSTIGNGRLPILIYFLGQGVNLLSQGGKGESPLHVAVYSRDRGAVDELISHLRAEEKLSIALEQADIYGKTPLSCCCNNTLGASDRGKSNLEICQILLDEGAVVGHEDSNTNTPLHVAAYEDIPDIIELLLRNGALLEKAGGGGLTPLHVAASNDAAKATKILLEKNARKESRDASSKTPLLTAAHSNAKNVVQILLEADVDITAKDKGDNNALHLAIKGFSLLQTEMRDTCEPKEMLRARVYIKQILEKLIKYQANKHEKNLEGKTPEMLIHELFVDSRIKKYLLTALNDVESSVKNDEEKKQQTQKGIKIGESPQGKHRGKHRGKQSKEKRRPNGPSEEVPKAAVPEVAVPKAAAPEVAVPKAAEPEAAVPEAVVQAAAVPEVKEPKPAVPEAAVPEAAIPEAVVPSEQVPWVKIVGRKPCASASDSSYKELQCKFDELADAIEYNRFTQYHRSKGYLRADEFATLSPRLLEMAIRSVELSICTEMLRLNQSQKTRSANKNPMTIVKYIEEILNLLKLNRKSKYIKLNSKSEYIKALSMARVLTFPGILQHICVQCSNQEGDISKQMVIKALQDHFPNVDKRNVHITNEKGALKVSGIPVCDTTVEIGFECEVTPNLDKGKPTSQSRCSLPFTALAGQGTNQFELLNGYGSE